MLMKGLCVLLSIGLQAPALLTGDNVCTAVSLLRRTVQQTNNVFLSYWRVEFIHILRAHNLWTCYSTRIVYRDTDVLVWNLRYDRERVFCVFLIPGWDSDPEQPAFTIRTSVRIISILRSTALQAHPSGEVTENSMQMIFNTRLLFIPVKSCVLCVCRIQSGSYLSTGWFTLILAMDMCKEIHIYGMINDTYCK